MKNRINIIWPERRSVTEAQVWSWYNDAIANHEIAEEYLFAHDLETAMRALSDSGLITFGDDQYKGEKLVGSTSYEPNIEED